MRKFLVSLLPKPVKETLKKLRASSEKGLESYEIRIAPFLAFKCSFLFWPFYKICQFFRVCFLTNISLGLGHIVVETDHFIRKLHLKEIDPNKRYVLIAKVNDFSKHFKLLFGHQFFQLICSSFLYYLTLPLLIKYPSITLDCGMSRTKWKLLPLSEEEPELLKNRINHWPKIITKRKNLLEWTEYYQRRARSRDFFPLRKELGKELKGFLGSSGKKLALIHYKTRSVNATAKNTDPSSYLPALEYLIDQGYQLVLAGREEMPHEFKKYDILDYPGSGLASFSNDVQLFSAASLAITGGSGIYLLADCLNVDLLYVNFWHLYRLSFSSNSLCVPTLVQDRSGRLLKFTEQWDLYLHAKDQQAEIFPFDQYEARNATAAEILTACKELIESKEDRMHRTSLQEQFWQLSYPFYPSEARISDHFLKQHEQLL